MFLFFEYVRFLFFFFWIQRFPFIEGLEIVTVVRYKGTFGVFPTAQCFLQLESDILPTLAGLLYHVVSAVYFLVVLRKKNTRFIVMTRDYSDILSLLFVFFLHFYICPCSVCIYFHAFFLFLVF